MHLFDLTTRLWECPSVPQVNKLPSRSPLFTWKTEEEARDGSYEPFECPAIESLNGKWDFWHFECPEEVPAGLLAGGGHGNGTRLAVPGNWTRQGFDAPHYINVCMPFDDTPPHVPHKNPCGVYRRNFHVREDVRRLVLHFGGIESCGFIYVNGAEVGMTKDSRTSSEFDITDYVHPGENQLTVLVIRWSDGSFVEDQDHWRMAGIFRDVYLQYTPEAYVADVFAQTTLDEETESVGILKLRVDAGFRGAHAIPAGWKFRVQVYRSGKPVWESPRELEFYKNPTMYLYGENLQPLAEETYEFPGVARWSAETPELYRLTVALVAPDGSVSEATGTDFGFRSVRRKNGCLLINGQPVKFFGVNRHDFDERLGKTVTPQGILQDLLLMKRFNLNAIRTSHYPNDERLTALANRLGLYVISEANIEIHAYVEHVSDDPLWLNSMMERFSRMVKIYKNNPCIHLWSLGNEAGRGANFWALASWGRKFDPSRGIHYCELTRQYNEETESLAPHDGEEIIDTVSPMYAAFNVMENWVRKNMPVESRPFILCEYSHAMGNSNGALHKYFEFFRKYPRFQGGYIWDWVDQGLEEHDGNGRKYWAYGGDYGEAKHDSDFCGNGMVSADRTPHPMCWEFKYLARVFDLRALHLSAGEFTLVNWNYFVTLDNLEFVWNLQLDGKTIQKGVVKPEATSGLQPQASRTLVIDYDLSTVQLRHGQELFLDVTAQLKEETPWAGRGFSVGGLQFDLTACVPSATLPEPGALPAGKLAFSENTINDGESLIHFTDGAMPDQWIFRGEKLLAGAMREQFIRGFVDNDIIRGFLETESFRRGAVWLKQWDILGLEPEEKLASSSMQEDGSLMMHTEASYKAKNGAAFGVRRRLAMRPTGALDVEVEFDVPAELSDMPRLGVTVPLSQGFDNLLFYGNGPHESYWDRKAGCQVGLYSQLVDEQLFPYVMPQESGNHTDVRMAALQNSKVGIMVVGLGMNLEVSALHYTPGDLYKARHVNELSPRKETWLNVDIHQRGLGTMSCGEDTVDECRLHAGVHRLAFRLFPYMVGNADVMALARILRR